MTVAEFIAKWRKVDLKERSAAQEHFLDLCALVGHPTPATADPTGVDFCFEKGAAKHGGGDGFADAWKRLFFGWEYKGRHKDLEAAFDQLLLYKDSLDNPPLLVVCDMDRIVIRTNFTGTAPAIYEIPLEKLGEPRNLEILHHVFFDPEKLKPGKTSETITQDAADHFARIADSMRDRGLDSGRVAHFLDRVVFSLFAEDIGLLPDMVFSRIVEKSAGDPVRFAKLIGQLFEAMAHGGDFGMESIRHFNGNLFDDCAVLDLTPNEVARIAETARLDWSAVDPSIFGTLFQRGLDPSMRAQLGAHFTGRADIELVVGAVVMAPLRREWNEARSVIESLLTTGKKAPRTGDQPVALPPATLRKARSEAASILHRFLTRLQTVTVLDPACGSGNFLYVTLLQLKDLEKEAILYAMDNDLGGFLPLVGPWQLYGIEINPYAFDLAQMTVWIGWLQWIRFNGFGQPQEPILRPMTGNFRCMDAIIASPPVATITRAANVSAASAPVSPPTEPDWPKVDFIVGNPPFLGDKMMRRELGDTYVDQLRALYAGRIPGQSDLCCYWFEKARAQIEAGKCQRAGLLATQGIRGGANREVLKRNKTSGNIFWAESDRPWVLDGANVHVSMVGFSNKLETTVGNKANSPAPSAILDGNPVTSINANLTAESDSVSAKPLPRNAGISFIGASMHGPFPLPEDRALEILRTPTPHHQPNSDVVRPWVNGLSITKRETALWIVDFPPTISVDQAAFYEAPFEYVKTTVKPIRDVNRRVMRARNWWLLGDPQKAMRTALLPLARYLGTPRVAKHRLFTWFNPEILSTDQVVVFARSDDLFFGVLHSHFHEVWALAQGSQLREKESGFRYTPTTCFETFPFPPGVIPEPRTLNPTHVAIATAAKELNALRENWLNPSEWTREDILEFPGTIGGPWDRYILNPEPRTLKPGAIAPVRYPRTVPRDAACAARLKDRTLTKLYNARPAWLADCHARLDAAVAAAYGFPADLTDDQILECLLQQNLTQAR
jgi:type II restriction/modification system DNA methylase subunit YeeA